MTGFCSSYCARIALVENKLLLLSDGLIAFAVTLISFNSYLDVLGGAAADLEHPELAKPEIRIISIIIYAVCILRKFNINIE